MSLTFEVPLGTSPSWTRGPFWLYSATAGGYIEQGFGERPTVYKHCKPMGHTGLDWVPSPARQVAYPSLTSQWPSRSWLPGTERWSLLRQYRYDPFGCDGHGYYAAFDHTDPGVGVMLRTFYGHLASAVEPPGVSMTKGFGLYDLYKPFAGLCQCSSIPDCCSKGCGYSEGVHCHFELRGKLADEIHVERQVIRYKSGISVTRYWLVSTYHKYLQGWYPWPGGRNIPVGTPAFDPGRIDPYEDCDLYINPATMKNGCDAGAFPINRLFALPST